MRVEILHTEDCPNWEKAGWRVKVAMHALHQPRSALEFRLVRSTREAESFMFPGSPTILLDGVDPFPHEAGVGLACRLYETENGLVGVPEIAQIAAAMKLHLRASDHAELVKADSHRDSDGHSFLE